MNALKLASVALPLTAACTNVIHPPPHPERATPVYLIDHGRHASLVLPVNADTVVRYAYGDWRYYAQRETGVIETSTAVLLPTRAGLGRRELVTNATAESVREAIGLGVESIHRINVDSIEVASLRRHLNAIFQEALDTRIYNRPYDLLFVHHPEEYTILRNSNRMVALWLRRLGCRVRGMLLFSRWRVE